MENNDSPELIEKRMQETRNSLTEKVSILENQVMDTVQTATSAVQTTVDTVKDTVENVKATVEETVCSVKDTVRQTFDFSGHVREQPWAMVGGAVAAGWLAGYFIGRGKERRSETEYRPFTAAPEPVRQERSEPSWFDKLVARAGDELRKLGESALDQATQSLHQAVNQSVPRLMHEVEDRLGVRLQGANGASVSGG